MRGASTSSAPTGDMVGKNKTGAKSDGGDDLQLGLVQTQLAYTASDERTITVFEGRDAAGKDGTIKAL